MCGLASVFAANKGNFECGAVFVEIEVFRHRGSLAKPKFAVLGVIAQVFVFATEENLGTELAVSDATMVARVYACANVAVGLNCDGVVVLHDLSIHKSITKIGKNVFTIEVEETDHRGTNHEMITVTQGAKERLSDSAFRELFGVASVASGLFALVLHEATLSVKVTLVEPKLSARVACDDARSHGSELFFATVTAAAAESIRT